VIFEAMNPVVITCCVFVALALLPAPVVRGAIATAAASLFEGTPLILAGALLQTLLSRHFGLRRGPMRAVTPLLGCGCDGGASARSLPAALATAVVFGPVPAILRFAAALFSTHVLSRRRGDDECCAREDPLLAQLATLLPAAVLAGVVVHLFNDLHFDRASPLLQWLAGAGFGFSASPCALGAVALAASLHARAPFAALGMLCVCGIVDIRALSHAPHRAQSHDALSYALLAAALAIVAVRGGDALLNPRFTIPIACCAIASAALTILFRRHRSSRSRVAPALMLAGALLAAPPPTYNATETTLADIFPGERVTFTGTLAHGRDADALVRFAVTCCRVDAAPVVLGLAGRVRYPAGTWLRAQGVVKRLAGALRLDARVRAIPPPADPFIYK
jgi:hypothetical protein